MSIYKEIIKNTLILFIITLCSGLLLGLTHTLTADARAEQAIKTRNAALQNVIGEADFKEYIEDEDAYQALLEKYPNVNAIYSAQVQNDILGYTFILSTKEGYGGEIQMAVGISSSGEIKGIDIIKHSETPGLGAKADKEPFKSQFKDLTAQPIIVKKSSAQRSQNEIDAIGGATITSQAVANAVNQAVDFYNSNIAGGQK